MSNITVEIKNIKGIGYSNFEMPLENEIYAFVGGNGTGKSTILQVFAQLIRPSNALLALRSNDYSQKSAANFWYDTNEDKWYYDGYRWKNQIFQHNRRSDRPNNIPVYGMYEGSLFVGTRFQDSKQVDDLLGSKRITPTDLYPAGDYVIEKLSYILHGDYSHYSSLKRLKNRALRDKHGLKNLPYFVDSLYGGLISQYRMSSGECLLISLLHFIYNAIIRSSLPKNISVLMLMDEIELALHPLAVSRFLDLIGDIVSEYTNVTAILTTHAPEVIRRISPSNIYKLENENGTVSMVNPCYPSYAIRELYTHDKYDYLILCEDALAKCFIEHLLDGDNLRNNKLICVLPVGGWENVLKMHMELVSNNVVGVGTVIMSVLDGDIECDCASKKEYKTLRKLFLPIKSIEKYLYSVLYNGTDKPFKKIIGDKYFQLNSIDAIIAEYNKEHTQTSKQSEKTFYKCLLKDLKNRNISEESFIERLCGDIIQNVDTKGFVRSLSSKLR